MAEVDNAGPASQPGGQIANNKDEASPNPPTDSQMSSTSLTDSGLSNRPRDARLLHMVLASYGVTAYQERVPLMLMDFAYRYTSATLSDALHFSSEGYGYSGNASGGRASGSNTLSDITLPALRLSIHSRAHYQYTPVLPAAVYTDLANERNTVALPPVKKEWGSILPPEQYCLLGNSYEMEEDQEEVGTDDTTMKDDNEAEDEEVEGEDVEGGKMEDIFGENVNGADENEMES